VSERSSASRPRRSRWSASYYSRARSATRRRWCLHTATMVSLVAYQGLRMPEERLGLEVKHVRKNTLLVEQRNIGGEIVRGQKVRGSDPCAIDLLDPVRRRLHDYSNWRRRVWKKARETARGRPAPAVRPTPCIRRPVDPGRHVDSRARGTDGALAADDGDHLHPRDPRAQGRAANLCREADQPSSVRGSWTLVGPQAGAGGA
jgi:hypothetical protein